MQFKAFRLFIPNCPFIAFLSLEGRVENKNATTLFPSPFQNFPTYTNDAVKVSWQKGEWEAGGRVFVLRTRRVEWITDAEKVSFLARLSLNPLTSCVIITTPQYSLSVSLSMVRARLVYVCESKGLVVIGIRDCRTITSDNSQWLVCVRKTNTNNKCAKPARDQWTHLGVRKRFSCQENS